MQKQLVNRITEYNRKRRSRAKHRVPKDVCDRMMIDAVESSPLWDDVEGLFHLYRGLEIANYGAVPPPVRWLIRNKHHTLWFRIPYDERRVYILRGINYL